MQLQLQYTTKSNKCSASSSLAPFNNIYMKDKPNKKDTEDDN